MKKEKEPVFKEWINARDITNADVSQGYGLRSGPNKGWVALFQNSFKNMLHLRQKRWSTLYCTCLHLGSNIYKNMGNTNAAVSQETSDSVVSYLTEIAKQFGESYATRFVRMLKKSKLHDEEKGLLICQTASRSAISLKNGASFVDGRQFGTKLEITSLKRETPRRHFGKSVTCSRFVLGRSFVIFGITTCPMYASAPIVMTPAVNTQFSIMHSGTANRTISNKKCPDESSSESDDDESQSDDFEVVELAMVNVAESFLLGDCAKEEAIIEAAAFHVEQVKFMCELDQKRAQEAKDDIENGVLHPEERHCLVCDFAQNLGIPHFGKYQPGDTYYYSPLTINLFGVVNLSRSPNKLDYYAYREFTGKKGSNNVSSLMMHNLHRRWMLQRYSPAERLTIIMDNCGGQNKNNHVLRLAANLVEMKYFRNVEFVFFVWGHTKNACSRLFNQMKIRFHKDQVHSYCMALKILNSQPNVSMIDATQDMFKDYGKMLDSFYSNFEPGTTQLWRCIVRPMMATLW
jgi:hypothetical protein